MQAAAGRGTRPSARNFREAGFGHRLAGLRRVEMKGAVEAPSEESLRT